MSTRVREQIVFTGRVQGVGFRYKLFYLADAFRVTGWVKNEYDGSVQAQLQGKPEELDQIIQRLGQDRYIELEGIDRRKIPLKEDEHLFEIRRS